jgi:hypothetical protein
LTTIRASASQRHFLSSRKVILLLKNIVYCIFISLFMLFLRVAPFGINSFIFKE